MIGTRELDADATMSCSVRRLRMVPDGRARKRDGLRDAGPKSADVIALGRGRHRATLAPRSLCARRMVRR